MKPQTRKRRSKISREFRLPANVMHEEAWEDDGPNMKLSRAFIVVLALHIVAVAGLVLFNFVGKKDEKIGQETKLPEKPVKAKEVRPATPAPGPATPVRPVRMEGMRAVKVEANTTTAQFAMMWGLRESELLDLNKHTPLQQGRLIQGETVYVPDSAQRVTEATLREAPVVTNPPAQPEVAQQDPPTIVQPTPPRRETTPRPRTVQAKPKPKPQPKPSSRSHKVRKNETLYSIGRKHGVSASALMRANGIRDPKRLQVGQTLKIPR